MTDAEYWKAVALYLADCHAATAEYDGTLKSTSKARRERFVSICQAAMGFLSRTGTISLNTGAEDRVMARLRDAVKGDKP